ncbi:MAG: DUF4097 family beta strand repeat protein [Bacilli bacterium]|nr:DUF4097 family beta strand repeat protein [Bacilli bacterium]MBN2696843.1 DUF4097 family beta strand repeat protein [Bacilli bacterium]
MNRTLTMGLILILIGTALSFTFGITSEGSFETYFGGEEFTYTELSYSADDFTGFDISLKNKAVTILPSTTGNIEIKYYETEKNWVDVDSDGATLMLDNDTEWYYNLILWFNIFRLNKYMQFYLYLPTDTSYDINLATSNGDVDLNDLIENHVSLSSSNGDINLTEASINGEFNATTANGRIILDSVDISEEAELFTSNGQIKLDDVTVPNIDLSTSNGKIIVSGITADVVHAETSNGDIEISVEGSLAEYHLVMATSNGSYYLNGVKVTANVYNTDQSKRIDAESSNGDVEIEFSN